VPSEVALGRQADREKPYGFSRQQRLLTGKDFKQVFDNARRVGNPYWTVYGFAHKESNRTQLGLAIAKKTVRRAHERNRLKRLTREAFRQMQAQLVGVNLVVMAGKAAEAADNATLNQQLVKLFTLFTPRIKKSTDNSSDRTAS
jgi:ribonuclease P protein component